MILAFGYQSRVGKDTCAEAVMKDESITIPKRRCAFASKLKQVSADLFGIYGLANQQDYEEGGEWANARDVLIAPVFKSPVEIWVAVGQKMREIYSDIWIDHVLRDHQEEELLVISDLRFPNEMLRIHALGGWCVLVRRCGNPVHGNDRFLSVAAEWDYIIENDGTLADLQEQARSIAREYVYWPSDESGG